MNVLAIQAGIEAMSRMPLWSLGLVLLHQLAACTSIGHTFLCGLGALSASIINIPRRESVTNRATLLFRVRAYGHIEIDKLPGERAALGDGLRSSPPPYFSSVGGICNLGFVTADVVPSAGLVCAISPQLRAGIGLSVNVPKSEVLLLLLSRWARDVWAATEGM